MVHDELLLFYFFQIEVNMASRSNNQWKKNAIIIKLDRGCNNAVLHAAGLLRLFYGPGHDLVCPIEPVSQINEHTKFESVKVSDIL